MLGMERAKTDLEASFSHPTSPTPTKAMMVSAAQPKPNTGFPWEGCSYNSSCPQGEITEIPTASQQEAAVMSPDLQT